MADTSTGIFRASLRGRLYRDIELPSSKPLEDLAAAIVNAFGFDFDHAFGFYSKLTGRDNVILTPHTAFYSVEALNELQTKCAADVARVLSGEKPVYPVKVG